MKHCKRLLISDRPNGVTFELRPESILPSLSPKPGEVVSFSFENYSRRDVPTNPFVEKIRYDLTWENVLQSYDESSRFQLLDGEFSPSPFSFSFPLLISALIDSSTKVFGFSSKPLGYWKESQNNNMRCFLEEYARDCGWDPLAAQNWYSVKHVDVLQRKVIGE